MADLPAQSLGQSQWLLGIHVLPINKIATDCLIVGNVGPLVTVTHSLVVLGQATLFLSTLHILSFLDNYACC